VNVDVVWDPIVKETPLNAVFENPKTTTVDPANNASVLGVTVYVAVVPSPFTVTENIAWTDEIGAETLNVDGVTPVTVIVLPVVMPCPQEVVLLPVVTQYDIVVVVDTGQFKGARLALLYTVMLPAVVTLALAVAFTNVIDVPEFITVTVYVP
jgi:hypothetical protein